MACESLVLQSPRSPLTVGRTETLDVPGVKRGLAQLAPTVRRLLTYQLMFMALIFVVSNGPQVRYVVVCLVSIYVVYLITRRYLANISLVNQPTDGEGVGPTGARTQYDHLIAFLISLQLQLFETPTHRAKHPAVVRDEVFAAKEVDRSHWFYNNITCHPRQRKIKAGDA